MYVEIWFRIHLVRVIIYRYTVALDLYKTEYNNSANQVFVLKNNVIQIQTASEKNTNQI